MIFEKCEKNEIIRYYRASLETVFSYLKKMSDIL